MNNILPSHKKICDFAKLTLLVYEYGKAYTVDNKTTIETFVSNVVENNEQDNYRMDVINELVKSSPHGRVHKFFNNQTTDLQVGITISDTNKRICVVFRGSESKYDWYYDLAFFKTQLHDDVYVHGGFYTQLHEECMYEQITIELKDLLMKYPDYDIYITGHSLGAALSTLYGYEISKEIPNKITVVSFASPRVGNTPFKTAFDSQPNLTHYRITNKRDIVTAAPNINFTHVGINITLTDSKYTIFYNYDYPWYYFTFFTCWSIGEHSMDVYYERLTKNIWYDNNI
jgi:predicted lipase